MVGFTPDENWQQVEYTFGSGEATRLFITTTPRLPKTRPKPLASSYGDVGRRRV